MSAPVPLPLTWHLYTTVHCPNCGKDFYFRRASDEHSNTREMFCPTEGCPQHGHVYLVEFSAFAVQVVKVIK